MSRPLSDDDVVSVVTFMSQARLQYFHNIAQSDRDAIELHQLSMRVSSALMPVVGIIEIAIRNAVCCELAASFGTPDWLHAPPPPFTFKGDETAKIRQAKSSAQRACYSKLSNTEKNALDAAAFPAGVPANINHETHTKRRQRTIQVTNGQIIAQLTLFFWKRLFSKDYEATLWKRALKNVFPNKRLSRSDISDHLEALYVCRNRIAHHEPIYGTRLRDALEAIDFVAHNFMAKRPSSDSPLAKILDPHMPLLSQSTAEFAQAITAFNAPSAPQGDG